VSSPFAIALAERSDEFGRSGSSFCSSWPRS